MDISILFAISPIILIILLLIVFKRPLFVSAPITFFFTFLIVWFYWRMSASHIIGSTLKGLFVAIDISIIIFGAIFFLEFLKRTKLLNSIVSYLEHISPDRRIQVIILVWFLGSFIEGSAGFGTPAAIIAPLLVGIGFPAVMAVVLALIGNSTAVAFGAVGTPIRVGLSGLPITGVVNNVAMINSIAGLIVPIFLVGVLIFGDKFLEKKEKKTYFLEILPFSLWAGFVLLVPYYLTSFLGQEFPSLLGSLVGLLIIIYTTKKGFLVPENIWRIRERKHNVDFSLKSLVPYIILILFLIIGKLVLPSFSLIITAGIKHSFNLFNPGLIFIVTIIIVAVLFGFSRKNVFGAAHDALSKLLYPFISILFITAFVQLMIYTGYNHSGITSMVNIISNLFKSPSLIFFSPFIGGFGAFIAGSATVSTLLFGSFQYSAAIDLGLSISALLALQVIGAGVGNMIALTNIVAAEATVKIHGYEHEILRKTIIPCIIYLLIVAIIGTILL